ncbi:MAG TPA: capsular biosynthesis protein [Salinivirgaceae bacterium]|nr:capsular biosynthesis protein [Salinivirgaceae bacterium]
MKDFSSIGVDIHSHIIPAIDDGSPTMEESLEILQWFQENGYRKVITTPHIQSDFFRNTPDNILSQLVHLRNAATDAGLTIEIEAAAEYYIDFDFHQNIINKQKMLTFGKNYLLVEMSTISPPEKFYQIIFELQLEKYNPVLAHPERYPYFTTGMQEYEKIIDRGVLLQLNIGSLLGFYGPDAQKTAQKLIDAQMISFIGSDIHSRNSLDFFKKILQNKWFISLLKSGKLLNTAL